MKNLSKIHLENHHVLNKNEMKKVIGGYSSGCLVDGEWIPINNCSDSYCKKLYGGKAECV